VIKFIQWDIQSDAVWLYWNKNEVVSSVFICIVEISRREMNGPYVRDHHPLYIAAETRCTQNNEPIDRIKYPERMEAKKAFQHEVSAIQVYADKRAKYCHICDDIRPSKNPPNSLCGFPSP
jgi:hypothetical protein